MNVSEKLSQNDIKQIALALGIDIKSKGPWITCGSPIRDDKNPSFGFNINNGAWKDHGTDERGDIVDLVERVMDLNTKEAIKWIKSKVHITNLYNGISKNGAHKVDKELSTRSFWTAANKRNIELARENIGNDIDRELLSVIEAYDSLKKSTLIKYGCGILEQWGQNYLSIPYPSGCQLYRRENGYKQIRSIKGSSPGSSLFGTKLTTGHSKLLITKSPRECMSVYQEIGNIVDVIGLATGEQGNLSKGQIDSLKSLISSNSYQEIYTVLDCDKEEALEITTSFTESVREIASQAGFKGEIGQLNIHNATDGRCKDIADCFREGMNAESFLALLDEADTVTTENERDVTVQDFYAYAPENKFIFIHTGELWPASSIRPRVTSPNKNMKATTWLSQNRSVEQMTWMPGEDMIIKDKLVSNGGWLSVPGLSTFNLYQPPQIKPGSSEKAKIWVKHIHRVYPDDATHLISWFAHRVQNPGEKVNHAIVMGGGQGIGKDTILEPVRRSVGSWNFEDVTPNQLMGRFNGFIKSVILRVSEARDMGDVDRYSLYEHLKIYTASPPEVLRCDEKNRREYGVLNVCGVVITTNHKAGGIYLPADDRRHYVAWSECNKDDFNEEYWKRLWAWYDSGGYRHVFAYLSDLDLSQFDPKSPPPKTDTFWEIVNAGRAPEDAEMVDALDELGNPDAVTIDAVAKAAGGDFYDWLNERRNRRQIPYRFETAGYVPIRKDSTKDGRWKVNGKNVVIYAKRDLAKRERIVAAQNLEKGEVPF